MGQFGLKYAMMGSLCVETDGSNLIHADMATTRMVKNGPIKVSLVRIVFETRSVGGVWLPSKFEMVAHATLLGKKFRTHNIYRYSDYRRP